MSSPIEIARRWLRTAETIEANGSRHLMDDEVALARALLDLTEAVEPCSYQPRMDLGQHHCPECGEMVMGGYPHMLGDVYEANVRAVLARIKGEASDAG